MNQWILSKMTAVKALIFHLERTICHNFNVSAFGCTIFFPETMGVEVSGEESKLPRWKKLNSLDLGISSSMISNPTRKVLNGLKREGYDVYLVGGCIRDLILKQTPKDFNIITTAQLIENKHVGRRFPICQMHIDDTTVEASSFSTSARNYDRGLTYEIERPAGFDENEFVRWRNCLQRDFTINGKMFDPYAMIIDDYTGGIEDIKKAKVVVPLVAMEIRINSHSPLRTVIPASTSFQEDCARILRAIRIAARLGFSFSRETAHFVKNLSSSILRLDKAAYFVRNGFRRRDKRSNMLLSLFSKLDRLLAPDRPCHSSLWVGILAFHKALSDKPRDPLVVAAFSLAIHNGGDISEAINIAKNIKTSHDSSFHELSEPRNPGNRALVNEVMDLAASVKRILCQMTDEHYVSQAMSAYPQTPFSDLVFIPLALYLKVCKVFECVTMGAENGFVAMRGSRIDYEWLALGSLGEIRHTFARVVFDTEYPIALT